MPQASGRLPKKLRRFRLVTAAALRQSLQDDDDSTLTEFGAHSEKLTIAGRLRARRRLIQQQQQQQRAKSKSNKKSNDDDEDGKNGDDDERIPPLTTTFRDGPETNSIGGTVRLSNRGGRYSHDYQYEDDNVPRTIRQLADLPRADATNTFLPSHIPVDPHQVSSKDFRQALVRELDADVLEVFFSLEFARDRRGREEMFDQLEMILTRIMKGVYLAGFTGEFSPVTLTAGEDKKWADYVQNRAHYKAVLRHKLKQELLGYQQLATKKLQILQEADDWFAGTTKLVDQEDAAANEQLSKNRYEAARLLLTDLKEMFDRMVAGLQRAKEYIEEGSRETSRFVAVQFEEEFMLKHGLILPPVPTTTPSSISDGTTPVGEGGRADGVEPPKKKKRKAAQTTAEVSAGESPPTGYAEDGRASAGQASPVDPNLLLPRAATARPADFIVLHNIAAHAMDPTYHPTALTTAKLLLYRAFGAQWTQAQDRKQFLALGFEQLDAFADGFRDLYRLKQEHQDQLMRQQTELHSTVIDRYKAELKKLQERCKRAEADKFELRQKYEFLKKQASDARMMGAVMLAGGSSAEQMRESDEQREAENAERQKRHARGPYQPSPSASMQEEDSKSRGPSNEEKGVVVLQKPAFGSRYGTAKPSTNVRKTPPNSTAMPVPSLTYTDEQNKNDDFDSSSQFPSAQQGTGEDSATVGEVRSSDDSKSAAGAVAGQLEEDDLFPEIEQFDDPNELYVVESQQNVGAAAAAATKGNKLSAAPAARGASPATRTQTSENLSRQQQQQRPPTFTDNKSTSETCNRKPEQQEQSKILALKALTVGHSPAHVRDLVLTAIPDTANELSFTVGHSTPPGDERARTSHVYKTVVAQLLSYLGRLSEGRPTIRSLEATNEAFEALRLAKQLPPVIAHGRSEVTPKILRDVIATLNNSGGDETSNCIRNIIDDALLKCEQQELIKVIIINAAYGGAAHAQLDKISDALEIGVEKHSLLDAFQQKMKTQLPSANVGNFLKCLLISTSRSQLDSTMTQTKFATPSDMARFWHALEACDTSGQLMRAVVSIFHTNSSKSPKRILLEICALFTCTPQIGQQLIEQHVQLYSSSSSESNNKKLNDFGKAVVDILKNENDSNKVEQTVYRALVTGSDLPEIFAILNAENVSLTDPNVEMVFVDAEMLFLNVEQREYSRVDRKKAKKASSKKPSDEEMNQNEIFLKNVLNKYGYFTSTLSEKEKLTLRLSEVFTAVAHAGNVRDAIGLLRAMSANNKQAECSDLEAQLFQILLSGYAGCSSSEIFGLLKAIAVSDSLQQLRSVIDLFQPQQQLKRTQVDGVLQRLGVLSANSSLYSTPLDFVVEQEKSYVVVAIMKLKQKMPFLRRALTVFAVCDDYEHMENVLLTLSLKDDAKRSGAEHFECMLEFATAVDDDGDENAPLTGGAAIGTVEALGISFDPADVITTLKFKTGGADFNSSPMLTTLYMLKLFGCGESAQTSSRLVTDNSVVNCLAHAAHKIVVAAAPQENDSDRITSPLTIAKTEIEAHDIIEMLVLAKNADDAVEILQALDSNQHVLHMSNTIDFTKLQQTIQFGRQTALLTCQSLALSTSPANILPIMNCLGVDQGDFMVNETFNALGYGLLSLTPQKIQQNQQKLRQQSTVAGGGGSSSGAADSGRRVSSALLQLNRKRRAELVAAANAAAAAGGSESSTPSGGSKSSGGSAASSIAERFAQQQQQQQQARKSAAAAAAEKDARKSKTLVAVSSRPATANSTASRNSTPDAQLSTTSSDHQQQSPFADGGGENLSSVTPEIEQKTPIELNAAFDREFEQFNQNIDDNLSSPSKSALLADQKKKLNLEPSFRVTNQVHIMARQHQRNPMQIGEADWETLKVQVEDLEHQLFEQTNLEQAQLQQIRWLKQEHTTVSAKLEHAVQHHQKSSTAAAKNEKKRSLKTELSQTPHEWFNSVMGLALSTATIPSSGKSSIPKSLTPPLADAVVSRKSSAQQISESDGTATDGDSSKSTSKAVLAKARQAINRAKLHAFVEKLKIIHYHATTSQLLRGSKSTLSPVKEEDEDDDDHSERIRLSKRQEPDSPSSPGPPSPPPTKLEALQIITNALDALGNDMVFSIGVVTDADNYRSVSNPPSPQQQALTDEQNDADEDEEEDEKRRERRQLEHKMSHTIVLEHVLVQLQQELVALVVTARDLVVQADKENLAIKEQHQLNLSSPSQAQLVQTAYVGEGERNLPPLPLDEAAVVAIMENNKQIEDKLESLAGAIDDVAVRYEAALDLQEKERDEQQQKQTATAAAQPTAAAGTKSRQTSAAAAAAARRLSGDRVQEPIVMQTVTNLTLNDLNTKLRHIARRLLVLPNGRISEEEEELPDDESTTGELATTEKVAAKKVRKEKVEFDENSAAEKGKEDQFLVAASALQGNIEQSETKTTTLPEKPAKAAAAASSDRKPAVSAKKSETVKPAQQSSTTTTTSVEAAKREKSPQPRPTTGSPPLKPSQSIKPLPTATATLPPPSASVSKQQRQKSVATVKTVTSNQPQQQQQTSEKPLAQLQRQLVLERQVTNTILQQLNVLSDDASIPQRISLQQTSTPPTTAAATSAAPAKEISTPSSLTASSISVATTSPQTRRQLQRIAATRAAIDHFKQEALVQRAQVSPPVLSSSPALSSSGTPLTPGDTGGSSSVTRPSEMYTADIGAMSEPVAIEAIAVEQRIRADLLSNINQLITSNALAERRASDDSFDIETADFTAQVRIPSPEKQISGTVPLADYEAMRLKLDHKITTLNETMLAETNKLMQHHKRLRIFFELKIRDMNDKHAKTFVLCAQRVQQIVTRSNQHAEDILYAVRVHLPENVSHNVPLTTLQVDAAQLQDDLETYFPEIYNELDRVMSATRFMVKAAVHQMDVKLADVYEEMENVANSGAGRHSSVGEGRTSGGKRRTVNAADDSEYQRLVGALQQMDLMLSDEKRSQALEMADKTRKLEQLMRDYAVLEQTSAKMKDQLVQQLDEKQQQIAKVKKECVQMKRIIDGQREKMSQLYDLLDARKRELQRTVVLKCGELRRACEQLHFAYEQQAIDVEVYEALRECTQVVRHLPHMQLCRIFERFVKYAYLRTNQQHLADDAVQRGLKLDFATRLKLTVTEKRISERNEQLEIDTRRTKKQRDEILGELSDTYTQLGLIIADKQLFDMNQLVLLPRKKLLKKSKSARKRRSSTSERLPNENIIAKLYGLAEKETFLATAAQQGGGGAKADDFTAEQPQNAGGDHLAFVRNVLMGQNAAADGNKKQQSFATTTYRKPGCDLDNSLDPSLYVKGLAMDVDKTHEIISKRKWTLTTPENDGENQQQQQNQLYGRAFQTEERGEKSGKTKPPFVYAQPYGVGYDINWHRIHGLRAATAAAAHAACGIPTTSKDKTARPQSANKISYPLAQSGLVYGDVDVNDVESVEAEGQVKTFVGTSLLRTTANVVPPAVASYANSYNIRGFLAVPPLDVCGSCNEVDDSADGMRAMDKREQVLRLIEEARYRHAFNAMMRKQQQQQRTNRNITAGHGHHHNSKVSPHVGASSPDLL